MKKLIFFILTVISVNLNAQVIYTTSMFMMDNESGVLYDEDPKDNLIVLTKRDDGIYELYLYVEKNRYLFEFKSTGAFTGESGKSWDSYESLEGALTLLVAKDKQLVLVRNNLGKSTSVYITKEGYKKYAKLIADKRE